jgi:hypothetical protein
MARVVRDCWRVSKAMRQLTRPQGNNDMRAKRKLLVMAVPDTLALHP